MRILRSWKKFIEAQDDHLLKSPSDPCNYRIVYLTNGLRMILVSDPDAFTAAAALDVHIGYWSDPSDIPGMAHLCEHMLYKGSEKYPGENEFQEFINEHGGSYNASTVGEYTNFHFDMPNIYDLDEALDRFAHHFICPLFADTVIGREVKAVNSEYDIEILNDENRISQVINATISPNHPCAKFGTGNIETLIIHPRMRGQNVQKELVEFHKKYYSSNIMSLAVISNESLDDLMKMTAPLFAQLENRNISLPIWKANPVRQEDTQVQINIVPTSDICKLVLSWSLMKAEHTIISNQYKYLTHLLNYEGPGSLSYELKSEGWVISFSANIEFESALGFSLMSIDVELTEDGMGHTNNIIIMVFQYLNMLREQGPRKWIWDECVKLADITFTFQGNLYPIENAKLLSRRLHLIPSTLNVTIKDILRYEYAMDRYQPELICNFLEQMTARNVRVTVVGKKFSGMTNQTEQWYGTPYSAYKIPQRTLQAWEDAGIHEKFYLPSKNKFIPEKSASCACNGKHNSSSHSHKRN